MQPDTSLSLSLCGVAGETLPPPSKSIPTSSAAPAPLELIAQAVSRITHGTVQIIIQDRRVVQIDTTEKIRLR